MIIETKFNLKELAFLIHRDRIIRLPVHDIKYESGRIEYTFLESKALQMMDKDKFIYRREKECFKTIDELTAFFEADNYKL